MEQKKKGLLSSQIFGIIWISVGLLLVLAVAFFSPKRDASECSEDTETRVNKVKLEQREDSLYQSRKQRAVYHVEKQRYNYQSNLSQDTSYRIATPRFTRQPLVVELNTADTTTLMLLSGIGPTFAKRIVNYRERLGGFVDCNQLLEVYGVTPGLLRRIAPYLTIDTTHIRRLDINSIALKQLIRHPYIEFYQARDIVTLRNSGIRFHSADDLRAVPSMADSTLQRLMSYLDFAQ